MNPGEIAYMRRTYDDPRGMNYIPQCIEVVIVADHGDGVEITMVEGVRDSIVVPADYLRVTPCGEGGVL